MEIPIQELLKRAKEAIQFNSEQFEIDDDGVRKTVSINLTDPSSAAASICQLGDYETDPEDSDKVIIIPGWLHAPNKSVLIEPASLTPTASTAVWIKCPWTATLNDDDVLEAGGELGTQLVETGATVPENVVPHVDSLTGTLYVPLGAWDADLNWIRQGCGSITVGFCPRVFSISRGGDA